MRVLLHAFGFVREAPRLYAVGFFRTERASLAYAGTEAEARAAFERADTGCHLDERMPDGKPRFQFVEDRSVVLVAQGDGCWAVHLGGSTVGFAKVHVPMNAPYLNPADGASLEAAGVKFTGGGG
jgi:hypothetical protein